MREEVDSIEDEVLEAVYGKGGPARSPLENLRRTNEAMLSLLQPRLRRVPPAPRFAPLVVVAAPDAPPPLRDFLRRHNPAVTVPSPRRPLTVFTT